MAEQIAYFEKFLRRCKHIHALFNFTALQGLDVNETNSALKLLFGNYTLCLKYLEGKATHQSPESPVPSYQKPVLITYFVLIAVLGLAINLCVIGTICRVRRLWTITNAFVLSLAMADFFMASILVPFNIWYIHYPGQDTDVKDTLFPLLGVASLLNLAAVTLERFLSISYPLTYDAHLTRFRATIIITSSWLVSVFLALLQLAFKNKSRRIQTLYEDLRFSFAFGLPLLCILFMNVKIYFVATKHASNRIHASNQKGQSGNSSRAFQKKLKTVKVIALLVGTFVVTWLPYFILSIYEHHTPYEQKTASFKVALKVAEALACGTTLVNPLLNGLLRKVREAMINGLKCQNVN